MMRNKRTWLAVLTLSLAGCGVEDSQQAPAEQQSQKAEKQLVSPLAIPLERVPLEFHRRAAQLLEDARGTESAPYWGTAVLAPAAQPLYRPDVTGVAYYEFRVLVREQPMGFIIVSTGAHDFPIAHWNFEGLAPTENLFQQGGTAITAFYKVDALTYVAEGSQGEMLANIGELPPRITGQDPSWLDRTFTPTDATWVTDVAAADDREASVVVVREEVRGPKTPTEPITLSGWSSWQELKAYYRESYGTLAESLKRQAAEEWETEKLAQESGEGLVVGRTLELALVYPEPRVSLSGEGASAVRSELVTTSAGTQKLVLTAFDAKPGAELPLTVAVSYPNGFTETLSIMVLAAEDVQQASGTQSADSKNEGVSWADMGTLDWSSYTHYWAGSHGAQRLYGQIPSGTSPNTSSCYSGCGATSWAMLFGWGDFQAGSGNPSWTHRWGLYRLNGGKSTGDAVAPVSMDSGVRNMTWELRNHIDTFCWSGSGATAPWNMGDASEYLKGRTGATLSTHYNVLGIHETRLREKARDSIRDRKVPAIIGTGWLKHYPLAYGYRWRSRTVKKCFIFCWTETEYQRNFYVNQGWSGSGNGWIGSGTWFAGQLYAN